MACRQKDEMIRGIQAATSNLEVGKGPRSGLSIQDICRGSDGKLTSGKHELHDLEAHHERGAYILTSTCLLKRMLVYQQACTRSVVMSTLRRIPTN